MFNDINQALVDKGVAAYKEIGIDAHGYVCDVTNEDAVNQFIAQVTEEVGVIDILVNNAGIIKRIPMHEMTAAEFRQVIDIDLKGPFIVSKAVIPHMIKKGHGKIITSDTRVFVEIQPLRVARTFSHFVTPICASRNGLPACNI